MFSHIKDELESQRQARWEENAVYTAVRFGVKKISYEVVTRQDTARATVMTMGRWESYVRIVRQVQEPIFLEYVCLLKILICPRGHTNILLSLISLMPNLCFLSIYIFQAKWSEILVTQPCLTICSPMDCSFPGSSVHGILQAKILEWVAISNSRGSSQPREQT